MDAVVVNDRAKIVIDDRGRAEDAFCGSDDGADGQLSSHCDEAYHQDDGRWPNDLIGHNGDTDGMHGWTTPWRGSFGVGTIESI